MEFSFADDPGLYILADFWCGMESKADQGERDRGSVSALADRGLCGLVVYPAVYYAGMFGDPFKDQCDHQDEVSGFGASGNGGVQGVFQSFVHAADRVYSVFYLRGVSEPLLAESDLLRVLLVCAGGSDRTDLFRIDHAVA